MPPKNKYYAVRNGNEPGIYSSWEAAKEQVNGYSGAVHRSFSTKEEALSYMNSTSDRSSNSSTDYKTSSSKYSSSYYGSSIYSSSNYATRKQESSKNESDSTTHRTMPFETTRISSSSDNSCSSQHNGRNRDDSYLLQFDGGARGNPGHSGAGSILYNKANMEKVWTTSQYCGKGTNNEAEYRALIHGLDGALNKNVKNICIEGDSKLVLSQLSGEAQVRAENLKPLHKQAMQSLSKFESVRLTHIPRELNSTADSLANKAMDSQCSSTSEFSS